MMKRILKSIAALAVAGVAASAAAQAWPTKPVRMIVPFPPGGTTDIMARVLAERLQASLGQPFVIENRGGAGGVIGTDVTAKAAPDGYTIMLSSSAPLAVGLKVYPKIPYDVTRDLAPVSMIGDVPMVLAVSPKFPARTVQELIDYAKANPGKLNVGLPSVGAQNHLLAELFRIRTGTAINMIPYKGSGPVVIDLMAGVVDADFENLPPVIEQIKAGKLRLLATLSPRRLEAFPDTPTFAELGMPDLVASPWFAMVAPSGTPAAIIARLNQEINRILAQPGVRETFAKQGATPVIATPEETGRFIRGEIDRWAKVVAETGAKLQ